MEKKNIEEVLDVLFNVLKEERILLICQDDEVFIINDRGNISLPIAKNEYLKKKVQEVLLNFNNE